MDMRLSPHDDHEAILKMIQGWMDEAGDGCTMEVVQLNPKFPMTSTEDSDPWWRAFSTACNKQCALYNSCVYCVITFMIVCIYMAIHVHSTLALRKQKANKGKVTHTTIPRQTNVCSK